MKVHAVEEKILEQLGLDNRRRYLNRRLIGKEERPLPHGADAPSETDRRQIVEKVAVEDVKTGKVIKVDAAVMELLKVLEDIPQTAEHKVAAVGRLSPDEQTERSDCRLAALPVGLGHRQFIEGGEECWGRALPFVYPRPMIQVMHLAALEPGSE